MDKLEYKKKKRETKKFLRRELSGFQYWSTDKFGYGQRIDKSRRMLWHFCSFEPVKRLDNNAVLYNKKDLDILNPDKIDNRLFWSSLNGRFKYSPVCGAPCKTEKDVNTKNIGNFHKLVERYKPIFQDAKMMEIGYGFGSFPYYCENWDFTPKPKEYYGVDYLNRIEQITYPDKYKFYETNGLKIPNTIPNDLDLVFSSNVFQHLSLKQKLNYFILSYNKLKPGGYFIFNSILRSDELMRDRPELWGKLDDNGIPYLQMFDQFIEVDDTEKLKEELIKIGYKIIEFSLREGNFFEIVLKKC